jgi:hypothetical protein
VLRAIEEVIVNIEVTCIRPAGAQLKRDFVHTRRARGRYSISAVRLFLLIVLSCFAAGRAAAEAPTVGSLCLRGARRTRESTVRELLPRPPPARYSDLELREFERRLWNLEIFDAVRVARRGSCLEVEVREKWTLIPSVDFASGKTWSDSYVLLGVTEYNLFGSANQLGLSAYREQRGWGTNLLFNEHMYRRNRWALGGEAYYSTARLRFADGSSWTVATGAAYVWVTSPPWLGDHLSYRVGAGYVREKPSQRRGGADPPDTHGALSFVAFVWDRYRWNDLVARGLKAELGLSTGFTLGPDLLAPRHGAELTAQGALPLARYTVMMARAFAGVLTRGSPNYNYLLGSVEGVRGLPDTFYRNWLQAYANLELRQALPLAERWAAQGVLFCDAAVFEQLNAAGGRGDSGAALGAGAGARLIPTWLAGLLVRVDAARLLLPQRAWLVQVGLSQYF